MPAPVRHSKSAGKQVTRSPKSWPWWAWCLLAAPIVLFVLVVWVLVGLQSAGNNAADGVSSPPQQAGAGNAEDDIASMAEDRVRAGDPDSEDEGYMPDFASMDAMDDGDSRQPSWTLTSPRGQIYLAAVGRSPIPNPGETIDKPLPFTIFETAENQAVTDTPADVVPWYDAEQYVGQTITIEGTIVHASNTGSVCFLNFDTNWREHFYVIVFEEAFPFLPGKPELYYMDKKIRVTGKVYRRNGRAQMRIEKDNWGQINVVEKK